MAEIKSIQIGSTTYDLRDDTKVVKNTAITAGTKCKITYDAKGLVTGGANLEASDIPSLGAGKITSGTFDTARIPSLAASKITSGTFDAARIPDLSSTYSVIGHNHDSSYVTDVAAITSVSDRGCIEVTKNGSSTYIKVDGWDEMVSSIPTTYAGSSSAGGAATSAAKLTNTSKIGDTNKPVYFTANGVPAAISYTIEKSVPSNASFTDTITTVSATTSVSCPNGALEVTVGTITTYPQVKGWDEKQAALPTTTTAGKVLKSTSTAGTVVWGDDSNTNTWRNIKVDGTEKLGTGTGTGALNFVSQNTNNGDITFTYDNGIKAKAKFPTLAAVATSGSYNDLSNKPTIPTDTNQKIKAGSVTFGNNDVVDIVAGDNVTVTGLASGTGAPKITISSTYTDTGATGVTITGSGNVFSSASYDASTRKITFTKGVTALTSHQSIKSLDTTATTAQSTSSSEAINGSGTIKLHKVSKTGKYSDLIGTPTLATVATSGLYSDLSGTPTIPTVNNSVITIKQTGISDQTFTLNGSATTITLVDTNTWRPIGTGATDAAAGNHTHGLTLATDTGTPTITLAHNTTYKLTAGGSAVIFKLPSDSNTNYYHTPAYSSGLKIATGTGVNDMYVPNGSTTTAGVLQIGTGATNAAAGNHSHTVFKGLRINTQTDTTPLVIARDGDSGNNEIVKYNVNDSVHNIYYTNDETSSAIKWTLVNTDTEGSTGVNASTHTMQVSASKTSISLTLDGTAVSMAGHTHSYAGSSSAGGAATSANKLNTNAGSTTQPVYFSNGVPVATSFSLAKSVPSDAKFTDTTYVAATTSADGLMSSTDKTKLNSIAVSTGTTKSVTVGSNTLTFGSNAFNSTTIPTAYAGSDSAGGTATSAAKLSNTSKIGDTNKPVYFSAAGTPIAISYTIEKSVPSDAKFTDTTYSAATTTTAGLMSAADKIKLNGIADGAEVNVQSNWNQTDTTADDYIKNKPTIPATNIIPATATGDKLLVSTTTSGTAKWSNWSSAGFLKTNASGVISIDTNSYLTTSGKAADSSKLNGQAASYYQVALPTTTTAGKVLKSTSTSGTVEWGSDSNTNYYHTTGSWDGLTYTAAANGGAPTLAFTLPTGTGANQVAVGNHNHNSSYVTNVAATTAVSEIGCIAVTKNGSTTYPKVNGWDNLVSTVGAKVTSIAESTVNGKIKFTKDGSTYTEVAVHGLGSNAFNSTTIPTTYLKSASVSGNTLTLTKQDNTTVTFTPSGGGGSLYLHKFVLSGYFDPGCGEYDFELHGHYVSSSTAAKYTESETDLLKLMSEGEIDYGIWQDDTWSVVKWPSSYSGKRGEITSWGFMWTGNDYSYDPPHYFMSTSNSGDFGMYDTYTTY